MKKIILSAMLVACYAIASALTVTVHNTSNSLGACDDCYYELNFKNLIFTKPGSFNWGYSELGYTNVAPGTSKSWTINPPAGYTPNWGTLEIRVKYCTTTIRTFGNSSPVIEDYNGCGCFSTLFQTYWFRNSDGDYDVQCEEQSFLRQGFEENDRSVDIAQSLTASYPTTVAPNPSTGMFTLMPGSELAGKTYSTQVTDAMGKIVFNKGNIAGGGPLQIDLTALPKGLYLLNIICDDKRITQRIVKD